MKLKFISRLAKDGSTPLPCPDDYIHFTSTLCMQKKAASLRQTIHVLDTVTATLFQLSVILSDALLIYRCYIILRGPWSWIISSVASLPLAASFSLLIVLLVPQHAGHNNPLLLWRVATYVSLLTNLIVSATLIIHLRKAAQRLTSLLGHASTTRTRTPYTRIIEMLVEAALPPLVSGIVHLILFAALKTQAITLNVLLLSFTVLAPQTNHRPSQGASEEIPTRPLAFSRSNPSSHIATLSESNSFMESTPQESR
ncbi:hypothetical protein BKA70DRAFT_1280285 [Coprinopsis sp. MPI-PUGE-AT-0042]|nr:hypothetical protein BKA70DRAFT_1280285 [Coprinopsis sp. MPI-PUGE-AT-0042]